MKLVIAINAKTYYPYSYGSRLLRIARSLDQVAKEYDVRAILAPPNSEIKDVKEVVEKVEVFAQHVDPVEPGAHTGATLLEGIKDYINGSIINHSERQLKLSEIEFVVSKLKKYGLESLVCAPTPKTSAAVAVLEPEMVAMEPPELIGTGISVSKAKPETIVNTVNALKQVNYKGIILVGAGISHGDDVAKALELGAHGVLVASAVVKAEDPYSKIKEFVEAGIHVFDKR